MTPVLDFAAKQEVKTGQLVAAKAKILVVDDRRENLLATEKILKHLEATLFKATSGNEALSLMLRHNFAVVLLDVQMPEMDGFETARLMQEHEDMRGTPIIFITAISKEEKYATQAAELGAVDYIFKPINPEILKSKIKVYLDLFIQHEQISALNGILTRSNEELERFAYICSHDMQEPVRLINSYADVLEHKYAEILDQDGKKFLNVISSHAKHMRTMINDILAFSRIGREEIKKELVDTKALLTEIIAEYESVIQEKNACITHVNLPKLQASPTLLRMLLSNLISNALKFQDGSRMPKIHVAAEKKSDTWQFSVSDNGIGIDSRYHNKVFAIFQRIQRRDDYPGTGIGLSACFKFVELCGGKIWFESVLNKGTVFYFTVT